MHDCNSYEHDTFAQDNEKAKLTEEELQHYLDLEQELEQEVREASAASASSACSSGRDVAAAAAAVGSCAAGLKPTEGGAADVPASSAVVPENENQQQTSAVAGPSAKDKSVEQEGNKNDTSPDMSKYSCTLDWFKEMQERHRQKGVTRADAVKNKTAGVLPGSLANISTTTKTTGASSSSAKLIVPAGKAAKLIVPVRKVPPLTQFPVAKVKEVTAFAIKKKPWMNVCPVLPEQVKKGSTAGANAAGAAEKMKQNANKNAASSSSSMATSSRLQLPPGNKKSEAGKATVFSENVVESHKQSARGTKRSSSSRSRSSSRSSSSRGRGKTRNASRPRRRRSAAREDHSRSRDRTGRSRRDHSRSPRRRDSRRTRHRDSRRRRRGRSRGRSGRRSRRRRSTSSRRRVRDRARSPSRRRSRTPTPRSRRERRGGGVTSPSVSAEDELVMQEVQENGGEPIITGTSSGDKKQEEVTGAPPTAVNYAAFSLPKGKGPGPPGGGVHLDGLVVPQEVAAIKPEENKGQPPDVDQVGANNKNSLNDNEEKRMKRMLMTEEEKQEGRKALLKALESIMSEENKEEQVNKEDGGPHMSMAGGDVQVRKDQGVINPEQQKENDTMNHEGEGEENSNGDLVQDVEVEPPQPEDDPFDEEFLQPVADNNPFAMASSCDIFNEDYTLFGQKKVDAPEDSNEDKENEDDSGRFNQDDPFNTAAPQVEPLHFDLADIYGSSGGGEDVLEPGAIIGENNDEEDHDIDSEGDNVLEENADLDLAFNTFPATEDVLEGSADAEAGENGAEESLPLDGKVESGGEQEHDDLEDREKVAGGRPPPALQINAQGDDPPPATGEGDAPTGGAQLPSPPPPEQSFSDWLKDYDNIKCKNVWVCRILTLVMRMLYDP